MKNRYGMDGMSFNARVNTSTGHIEILNEISEEEEEEMVKSNKSNSKFTGNIDNLDREYLAQQFFTLNS
jgi:hypothetical protein